MNSIVIGNVTAQVKSFMTARGICEFYNLESCFLKTIFSLPAHNNFFCENDDGAKVFCEIAYHIANIENIVIDYDFLTSISESLKKQLSLYIDLFAEYCSVYIVSCGKESPALSFGFMERKAYLVNYNDINDLKVIGADYNYHEKHVSIFGSCVSRDTIEISNVLTVCSMKMSEYIARNSIAGILSSSVQYPEQEVNLQSAFLRRCVHHDLKKTALHSLLDSLSFGKNLIIDFMDERFDLIRVEDGLLTNSWDYRATSLSKKISVNKTVYKFDSIEKFRLWKDGFDKLYIAASKIITSDNILILLPLMTSILYSDNGFSKFENNKYFIQEYNEMLNIMTTHLVGNYPGIRLIKPLSWMLFCDYRHKWGAHPYHYNNYLYLYFSRLIKKG
ncbi:DUF6270 domain-containing protein [Cronobacter dublinensis]|uniref:DUF6270 domain-containing protein n=1 Tax=Cronobacter dublinensis TaxID=413497 RepID=UPI000CFBB770|nr:DUF6270 domain-containing protein [Cronobacter dublinensis]EKY3224090.1 hypothetical protein [Cronobacter dublinensis]ELQ6124838.1 hypothetical protein [Cronobacter dublinensis]ELQ6134611.1 hypothetical protein [Cronobacter dublinensis]